MAKNISNIKYCIFWEAFYNISHNIQTSCVHDDVYLNNKMKNTTTIKNHINQVLLLVHNKKRELQHMLMTKYATNVTEQSAVFLLSSSILQKFKLYFFVV